MARKDYYNISKNVEKIMRNESTNFLNPSMLKKVTSRLKKYNYKVYYPYEDCDKVLLYTDKKPKIRLIEIISNDLLKHRDILGSLFGLKIVDDVFGDIIITDNHYYVIVLDSIFGHVIDELKVIGNKRVVLKEANLSVLKNYRRKYLEIKIVVPSIRLDIVVTKILNLSRGEVKRKIINQEVVLNYELCGKVSYVLKSGDVFSIKRYGKYKFDSIVETTKKGSYVVKIYRYI